MGSDDDGAAVRAYYERGLERERLDDGVGRLERERTIEILTRHLPAPPARVADIGGGPGRYATWLAELGYDVSLRDVVPSHVDQARSAAARVDVDGAGRVDARVADARHLDLGDVSVDAVLLLGPLYHLPARSDRRAALREARRVVRPGGLVVVAAISRWATRVHGVLVEQHHRRAPALVDQLPVVESSGHLVPVHAGAFTGFSHRPDELAAEVADTDLDLVELVGVEGVSAFATDLAARLDDPVEHELILRSARATEHVPELLGVGPHLLAVARRPAAEAHEHGG